MTIIIAYACMCAISAGIVYGALEWLIRDIIFEHIGKKRRKRMDENPKPRLKLVRRGNR